jgi:hypothetical protein
MEVDWLGTVTSVVYLGCMEVDWLGTVTSVVYLGVWRLTGWAQSLQSFMWVYGG